MSLSHRIWVMSHIIATPLGAYVLDTGAAVTKPPPPVIFLPAAVSHIWIWLSQSYFQWLAVAKLL